MIFIQQMFDDARRQGVNPVIRKGFRTRELQEEIIQNRISKYIYEGYFKCKLKIKPLKK